MQWIRHYYEDEDTWLILELDDDGWARRHVELRGPDQEPIMATALDEVMHARDHGGLAAVQAYERKYGTLAEGDVSQWDPAEHDVAQITAAQFEEVWVRARRAIEKIT